MTAASATIPVGYKQTEVGVIPEDWDVISASQSCLKIQDGTHFSPKKRGTEYLYVTSKNIRFGHLEIHTAERISVDEHRKIYRRCDVKKGDLLLTKDGASTGNAALNTLEEEFSLLSSVAFLRFDPKKYSSSYFLQQFLSNWGQNQIQAAMTGNAITRLTLKIINKLRFAVPKTILEQEKIATNLTDADGLIRSIEELIIKKQNIKQGAMQELLTGKTRLSGFSDEWGVKSIGDIAQVIGGGTPSTQVSKYWGGEIKWLTPTEVGSTKYISESGRKLTDLGLQNSSASFLPVGAILLTSRAGIGDLGILDAPACTNQGFQSLVCNDKMNNEFLYYVMLTKRPELERRSSGSTFLEISPSEVKSVLIALPSFNEQVAIAEVLSDMDAEIVALDQRLEKTKAIKQGMMQQLLTGRIRLVDPSTPVEASA